MKRTLFLTLAVLGSSLAAATTTETSYTLGDVMYVGDSITHGYGAASYRWAMHKILVDNGISYEEVGVNTGNASGGVTAGTVYGGVAFENEHSSQSSARAWEVAGRSAGTRFNGTNIKNWLGQAGTTAAGSTYTGTVFAGENAPDTFFVLLGTNDLLSDSGGVNQPANLSSKTTNLLGDMETIVDSMYAANSSAAVYVSTIPCWTLHNNSNTADFHEAIQTYNESLTAWVKEYNKTNSTNVVLVDPNKGMIDVASDTPFYGVQSMFRAPGTDGLHPSAQGDLIMAGNYARAMGYAGRTAGQQRQAAAEFALTVGADNAATTQNTTLSNVSAAGGVLDFSADGASSLSIDWENAGAVNGGFTLELGDWSVGNGSAGGWNTSDNLSIVLGNDSFYGTLNINEAYIQWGDTILYSEDMSALGASEALRVAYLSGSASEGLGAGFYVWLGDMLIGEALNKTMAEGYNGVTLTYSGSGEVTLGSLSLNAEASYAPVTTGISNEDGAFLAQVMAAPVPAAPQGNVTLPTTYTQTHEVTSTVSGNNTTVEIMSGIANASSATDTVSVTGHLQTVKLAYANMSSRQGDLYVTFDSGRADGWAAAHGGNNNTTLTGNVTLMLKGGYQGGSTVFGAVNAASVTGNVTLVFDAQSASYGSFTGNLGNQASVVGAYATDIGGAFKAVINAGTFEYDILGGVHTGTKSIGRTELYINGGTIKGNVIGGSYSAGGTIGSAAEGSTAPATLVTITNGAIEGAVYGGGHGGTINGDTLVHITGGAIKGPVYGGGAALTLTKNNSTYTSTGGTINGNTCVTIDGTLAAFYGDMISSAGSGGTITGNTRLVIRNVAASDYDYRIDKYTGTLSGGAESSVGGTRKLEFDNARLRGTAFELAALENFDVITLSGGSDVQLSSLGGASEIELTSSILVAQGDTASVNLITMDATSSLTLTNLTGSEENPIVIRLLGETVDVSKISITLTGNELEHGAILENVLIYANGEEYTAAIAWHDRQAGNRNVVVASSFAPVPEPATATLGLLALAGLAARRRRK